MAAQSAAGAGGIKVVAGIIIFVIVIGTTAFALLGGFSKGPSFTLPSFPVTNGTVPASLSNASSQPGGALNNLAILTAAQLNSTPQFHANYSGQAYINPLRLSHSFLGIGQFQTDVTMWVAKYDNSTKFSAYASYVPLIGAQGVQYANLSTGQYSCSTFNYTDIGDGNYAALATSKGNECAEGGEILGIGLAGLGSFDYTQLQNEVQMNYNPPYESAFNGTPCTVISASLNQPSENGTGTFIECISNTDYTPYSIGLSFASSQVRLLLYFNSTSMGNSSVQSIVQSLPYSSS